MHEPATGVADPVPGVDPRAQHPGLTDADLGRALGWGTLLGIPIMWAVGFALMLPAVDAAAAFGASLFVGVFTGPFVGALILLMRRIIQVEHGN